ncbi:heptaprenyl diphosphate synthase component II [Numidum massiliense]|uniref:heptaprenyl diphosphate synthase component II n=1 Tax=Numidum massiliense TaxID=1522315 RepID=UPI0006D53FF5|nr:heptaprenyl diphosphate synthase component II [Numidum massiliense]
MNLADVYFDLKGDLEELERELSSAIATDHPVLNEASHHLLRAGGKRIRPVFVLLAGKFGNYSLERLKLVAAPLELIHMATLVHDDVIDDAETRRGRKTVRAEWDNRIAMYTGDYIFARSLKMIAHLPDPKIHRALSNVVVQVCEGEIEQIRDFYNWQQNLRNYLRRIKRKTALLIAVSCELGAMVSEAQPQDVRALRDFGYYVGMAFQVIDDILDFTGTEKQLGKPAGSDLRQGNITLPVLYLLAHADEATRQPIINYIQSEGAAHPAEEIVQLIKESEGITFAQSLADKYLNKGLHALYKLPHNEARDALEQLALFVGKRSY